ncbi:hypothetical protein BHYA_0111g00250 [Botrytis hyacinthi]|uniref:Uncharacterized protein n=1 Tax=Botrytis hyacinthi TaxID=278943 RepID=A0A4Z1GJT5_9HELO|nr:hypothetical protein BHYA_0111g00250 [Botrytis hyacinthi]
MARKDRTLDVDSTSNTLTADTMMAKIKIRDNVWRLILLRPVAIMPRVRKREYLFATGSQAEGHKHCRFQRKFSYDWAQAPVPETCFGGNSISREIAWTTNPTCEELKIIQTGVKEFTINDPPEPGQQIKCAVHHRDGFGPQIIKKTEFQIHPFGRSVGIMRVCKQMEQECTVILYGENKYEFDISDCYRMHQLKTPWNVPGFPLFEKLPSKTTISIAVENLFDLECYQPAFIAKDPLIRFMAYIGRKNSSLLRDIKFDGGFTLTLKTRGERSPTLGFGAILPMYTLIIAEVPVRSDIYSRHKDSLEHERPGSYGTSTCTWTVTRCPSQTNPGSVGKSPRDSHHRKDSYGFLPEKPDDVWKCSDAHGGVRRNHGRILNISTKVDQDSAPRTWVPGQRARTCLSDIRIARAPVGWY